MCKSRKVMTMKNKIGRRIQAEEYACPFIFEKFNTQDGVGTEFNTQNGVGTKPNL